MQQSTKLKEIQENILSYLLSIDSEEYPNIKDLIENETMANRVINDLIDKMFNDENLSLEDAVDQMEISLSIQ